MNKQRFLRSVWACLLMIAGSVLPATAATDAVVRLKPGASLLEVLSLLDGSVLGEIPDARTYLLSVPALPPLSLPLPGVEYIEANEIVLLPGVLQVGVLEGSGGTAAHWYGAQPALQVVRSSSAHDHARGRGVVVADIDARFDYAHPALAGQLTSGYDFVAGQSSTANLDQSSMNWMFEGSSTLDQSSMNWMFEDTGFLDQSSMNWMFEEAGIRFVPDSVIRLLDSRGAAYSHGTMTAGLIAVTAPEAMIMPIRAFDDDGQSDLFTLAKAIRYAVNNGAHVINMSWGTLTNSRTLEAAIKVARERDVILVGAAGNMNGDAPYFPAAYPEVMAVAATDDLDRKAAFSNFGGHIWVDAPGVNVFSAYPGGGYGMSSGTSFSAPIVSGQAALVRSLQFDGIELQIGATAVDIDGRNPEYAGQLGLGRSDMLQSVSGASGEDLSESDDAEGGGGGLLDGLSGGLR